MYKTAATVVGEGEGCLEDTGETSKEVEASLKLRVKWTHIHQQPPLKQQLESRSWSVCCRTSGQARQGGEGRSNSFARQSENESLGTFDGTVQHKGSDYAVRKKVLCRFIFCSSKYKQCKCILKSTTTVLRF